MDWDVGAPVEDTDNKLGNFVKDDFDFFEYDHITSKSRCYDNTKKV